MRRLGLILAAVIVAAVLPHAVDAGAKSSSSSGPHVWIIVLENKTIEETFGPDSPAPYLAHTLTAQGAFLSEYYGTGHFSLDNYISMVSGQAPNPATQSDCIAYADFVSPTLGALDSDGQALGAGCVYPSTVPTIADQFDEAGVTWKGYMEDMATPCRHPAVNSMDDTQQAEIGDQYATRHNPFMYFHSIIDDDESCKEHVVDLSQLEPDLASKATTPAFSFITPNLCNDGHDAPCVDGAPGGLVSADGFLQEWVPKITSSPAFTRDGVLIVMFDESEAANEELDTRSCCDQPRGPNTLMPGIAGHGGGRMGAVVLSPFVRPGTVSDVPYNHYSLLRSLEDMYRLDHLGYAAQDGLRPLGKDVFREGLPQRARQR